MAPILLDTRDLIKLALLSLLAMLAIFVAGYFSGYQKAAVFYASSNEVEVLALPEKTAADDIEPKLPEKVLAGAEIDVDQPVTVKAKKTLANKENNNAIEKKQVTAKPAPDKTISNKPAVKNQSPEQNKPVAADKTDEANAVAAAAEEAPFVLEPTEVATLSDDQLKRIKYSVQVGMYGDLHNAEIMMNALREKKFDAYVSDYTNKNNKVRYNVRFGYFPSKQMARDALKQYKEKEQGDGYLVNFSVDSIVNVAETKNIQNNVQPPDVIQNKQQAPTPAEPAPENNAVPVAPDTVSPGVGTQSAVLSRLQTKAVPAP